MANTRKKLPVGIENFEEIRTEGFYYIDKTGFIKDLLANWGKVNLFTRPRRFGKTLNMSMLKSFFEVGTNKSLFDGLAISQETELCTQYMGNFPVIFISLKSVSGLTFDVALENMGQVILREARRLQFLLESDRLTELDKKPLRALYEDEISPKNQRNSLSLLSELLYKHYGKKVILLIDEYDVPLDKAYENNYYDEMAAHIRSMFELALKTNDFLYFAVLTGCLRISRESIFTGLNDFNVHTISDAAYDEYFGFTDDEVQTLLSDYAMETQYQTVKEWYDGYLFGKENIYCPWDVICYVKDYLADVTAEPLMYWANSSSNSIIKSIIEHATGTIKEQIETLISGGVVEKELVHELTYNDLAIEDPDEHLTYLWSILYTTGYLTDAERTTKRLHKLVIPNMEVQQIFEKQIRVWFNRLVKSDTRKLQAFCFALKTGNADELQTRFNEYLLNSISIRDTYTRKDMKENFYHGVLVGLLSSESSWIVKSNTESGNGYSDILIEIPAEKIGCIIEVKYAENRNFDAMCAKALKQTDDTHYTSKLRLDGMKTIHIYGIACHLKECQVVYKKIEL